MLDAMKALFRLCRCEIIRTLLPQKKRMNSHLR